MMQRRHFVQTLGAGSAAAGLGLLGGCAAGGSGAKVVVVGGGYGGATAAKYVRLFSDHGVDVTLVEPNAAFVSCPISNLVLNGAKTINDITTPYDNLSKRHGVRGERYQVVKQPRGDGLHGLQVPVFGPTGLEGAVSFAGASIDASASARLLLEMVGTSAFRAARQLAEAPADIPAGALSAREREVLRWVAAGRRQAEIAATLGLSARTVENHLRRARQRLGVATTAQAVRKPVNDPGPLPKAMASSSARVQPTSCTRDCTVGIKVADDCAPPGPS